MSAEVIELRDRLNLDDYEPVDVVAAAFGRSRRTLIGWRKHGFPIARLGGAGYVVHVPRARRWLLTRTGALDPDNAA